MTDLLDKLAPEMKERLKKESMPDFARPMLATLTERRFSSPDWIYERKLDGERCLIFKRKGEVSIFSRNHMRLNDTYPELEESFENLEQDDLIVDGELVTFDGRRTSFSRLQQRMLITYREEARGSDIKVHVYLFDILHLH
jgi:bifunctional non-homologous end joining protein LigD